MSACGMQTALGVEQLRRLVEMQQRIVALWTHQPPYHHHHPASHPQPYSTTPPLGFVVDPFHRRTSAPAVCAGAGAVESSTLWMDAVAAARLRSQSLGSAGNSTSSSPAVDHTLLANVIAPHVRLFQ